MGKASNRFHSRYHFAFDYGHSNQYHFLLFGKERHWQRSTLLVKYILPVFDLVVKVYPKPIHLRYPQVLEFV